MLPTKINDQELSESLVSRLPLRPGAKSKYRGAPMTGEEIRAAFDRTSLLLAERLNQVIALLSDDADSTTGIGSLPYNGITLGEALDELNSLMRVADKQISELKASNAALNAEIENARDVVDSAHLVADQAYIQANKAFETLGEVKRAAAQAADSAEIASESAKQAEGQAKKLTERFEETNSNAEYALRLAEAAEGNSALALQDISQIHLLHNSLEADHIDLRRAHTALEEDHARVANLAENAVPASEKAGIYAHDYDSPTGSYIDRTIKYSPYFNSVSYSRWSIVQRDGNGCIEAYVPTTDYGLTPKIYVDGNFRPKSKFATKSVAAIVYLENWTEGECVYYENGGAATSDPDMRTVNLDGVFKVGEKVTFYADSPNATVSDLNHGDYKTEYDSERGAFIYEYTQKEGDAEGLTSCRVNAPLDCLVYYTSKESADAFPLTLEAGYEYALSGCGMKTVTLGAGDPFYWFRGGEARVHFSSDSVKVTVNAALPIGFSGDDCHDGQLEIKENKRYTLAFSYDGLGMLCRVSAYPLNAVTEDV